ncbi:midasin, partial [Trifolium pratense]
MTRLSILSSLDQLKSVFDLMSSWHKMELGSWPTLLDEVMDQYENNAKKVTFEMISYDKKQKHASDGPARNFVSHFKRVGHIKN